MIEAPAAAEEADQQSVVNGCADADEGFRLVTWNVWFDILEADTRRECLLNEALSHWPHLICLQEVTPKVSLLPVLPPP